LTRRAVTIREGPFQNCEGTVESTVPDKGIVRVLVTIFGRQVPVDVEHWQVAKAGALGRQSSWQTAAVAPLRI
jgi:hypothetical protein